MLDSDGHSSDKKLVFDESIGKNTPQRPVSADIKGEIDSKMKPYSE